MIWILCRLGVLMMALGGCSPLLMRGVQPDWDGEQEPECSDSHLPIYVDGFMASLAASYAAEIAGSELSGAGTVMAGAVVTSLLFTASAFSGASKYKECRKIRADWHARQAINELGPSSAVEPAAASGYFCTSSPSRPELHACMREHATCEKVRKTLALPDSEGCAPRDMAWCFDMYGAPRCSGTQYACEAQGAASAAPSACTKRP
jgi:hypothetical protein